ncbi:MAG: D-Ala-D-Ala carboxypeptidase family metallohydrolase, partial [Terriglobia bacterium]
GRQTKEPGGVKPPIQGAGEAALPVSSAPTDPISAEDGKHSAPTGQYVLPSFTIAGYSTEDVSLSSVMNELPLPLPFCSIRIQYSGAPGSAEAEVSSVEAGSNMVVDARAENEGNGWVGSGANPWHLDKDTDSVLFLTNMSDKPCPIGFELTANGVHYYLTNLNLNPHETRAIDIRALRDAQVADFKGNKIPAAATNGSVNWVRLDDVLVEGRLMVIKRHEGVASSYDCNTCPCPPPLYAMYMTAPGSCALLLGQTMQCQCYAYYNTCNENTFPDLATGAATWTSGNTAVITVDGSVKGEVHAVGNGAADITATLLGRTSTQKGPPPGHCVFSPVTKTARMPMTVGACGDQRDSIIPQYQTYPTSPQFIPVCADFTNNASTANFAFAELNVNQWYPWAILRSVFLNGLQNTRNAYGSAMIVNSGYREPAYNAGIGGARSSQHVFGTAADIASDSNTWKSLAHDANQEGGCVEPTQDQGGSYAHVHMDWRGACPSGWTGF